MLSSQSNPSNLGELDLNQPSMRKLVEQIKSGPGVVPFVGAGLSVPFGLPGWSGFLTRLACRAGKLKTVESILGEGRYEEAAEIVREALAPLAFDDALEEAFGHAAIVEPNRPVAVELLPLVSRGPVITTNFDKVLEQEFAKAGRPFEQIVWGVTTSSMLGALQVNRRFLLKVHGDVEDSHNRVLTRHEYNEQYGELIAGEVETKPLALLLQRLVESRTMLFVGCSLQDDRLVTILRQCADQRDAFVHYAILPEPRSPEKKRSRSKFLSERNIRPIWYPDRQHNLIVPLLQHLISLAAAPDVAPRHTLVSADEYFGPYLRPSPSRLFHHGWTLVGREATLSHLEDWVGEIEKPIAILSGRGGVGKSKILHAFSLGFSERHPDASLRFALQEIPFQDGLNLLPGKNLIVVDDAHRRDDIGTLLEFAQRHRDRVKVLVVSRPYRVDYLRSKIGQARFDVRELENLGELGELDRSDVQKLARQALSEPFEAYADRLAELTRDSPLITVLGGQLLAERAVSPDLLERDEEFRSDLLTRFQDEIMGRVSDDIDPGFVTKVLQLVAAAAPIRPELDLFLQTSASLLGSSSGEVLAAIDALEVGGILLRRGRALKITPDVLADHVLHRACMTSSGKPTGFAQVVFDAFKGSAPAAVLENLAELDWRIRSSSGDDTRLLDGIWESLTAEWREGSRRRRRALLELLVDVAYFQPDRTLLLVESAKQNPSSPTPDLPDSWPFNVDPSELEILPRLLRHIAYTQEYLPRCCDLLWELGRDDERPPNAHPDHGMRVLIDLASYDLGKRLSVNAKVVDSVERWIRQPDAHDHKNSPMDVLDPILAKVGRNDFVDGPMWGWRNFLIDPIATGPLRTKALKLISSQLHGKKIQVTLRALESLFSAVGELGVVSGLSVTEDDIAAWLPERLQVLDVIESVITHSPDPIVSFQTAKSLAWHTDSRRFNGVATRAKEIIDKIPRTLETLLLAGLASDWSLWPVANGSYSTGDVDELTQRSQLAVKELVRSFLSNYSNAREAAEALEKALSRLVELGIQVAPWMFWGELAKQGPEILMGITELIVEEPSPQLTGHIGVLISYLREIDQTQAIDIITRILDRGHVVACRAVASWGRYCAPDLQAGDITLLERLVGHDDPYVRQITVESVEPLARAQPELIRRLALSVDMGQDRQTAEAVCRALVAVSEMGSTWLDSDTVDRILHKLRLVTHIDGYFVGRFLMLACRQRLLQLTHMFLERILESGSHAAADFSPLPTQELEEIFASAAEHPEYVEVLTTLRERALRDEWQMEFWLPDLFNAVSGGYSPSALNLLNEWASNNDARKVLAVSRLLRGAPTGFVFDHEEFTAALLEHAFRQGEDVYAQVTSDLCRSTLKGSRQRTLGVENVFKVDVIQAERSKQSMANLVAGSPAYRFFKLLNDRAEESMVRERLSDEEEFG